MAKKTLLLLAGILLAAEAEAISLSEFQSRMEKHAGALAHKGEVSVYVETLGAGKPLFAHKAEARLNPASSSKLVTTLSALEKMGPGFSFETKVFLKGGDLILQGNGDPYLVSERLWLIARDVARSGIKKVGAVKVNNSNFTENYRGLMEWDDTSEPFTAMVSATSLNFNSLEVHIVPEKGARKPRVEVGPIPHAYATLQNEVVMTGGSKSNVTVSSVRVSGNKEIFRVTGTIGRDASPRIEYASVRLPDSHIAHVFAAMLRHEGVSVGEDFGGASNGALDGDPIASQESLPLLDQVRLLNTFSNNFMTEQVFQGLGAAALGGPASISKSRQAASEYLKSREHCRDSDFDNGSGLSWKTRVSARCFADLLQNSYRDFRVFADLLGSLPVGGETGSLKRRFKRLGSGFSPWKVRAKTGTLWSQQAVTSLVGFTQTASGEQVIFAILQNDSKPGASNLQGMRDWEDKCVEYIQQLQL